MISTGLANPDLIARIHPQYVTRLVSELATEDTVFTCDVGTPIAWTARYLKLNGKRRPIGSVNHGSMANAMLQAIGAQSAFPNRQVVSSSVPPIMVKTADNPEGLPKEVFDGFQAQTAYNRAQFYLDVPTGPFFGYNRPGAKISLGNIQSWWRQGMMGGVKAHYDGIVAFSQTDFVPDLKKITVPTLVMHGDDDQIVPYVDSGLLTAKLVKGAVLKIYKGFPHGMHTTNPDTINADLLQFIQS